MRGSVKRTDGRTVVFRDGISLSNFTDAARAYNGLIIALEGRQPHVDEFIDFIVEKGYGQPENNDVPRQ